MQSGVTETGGSDALGLARFVDLAFLATTHLLSRDGRFGADAELTVREGDQHISIKRLVGADVAWLTEKDESIALHGLDVVNRQVFPRSANKARSLGDLPGIDEFARLPSNLPVFLLVRVAATADVSAFVFRFLSLSTPPLAE